MTAVILKGMAARKLRAALTAVAIVLGVAMISGTYVLMDTTMHAFNSVFTTAYAKADAVVVGRAPIAGTHSGAPPVPAALAARIRALAQVSDAQGFIDDKAQIRDAKGAAITGPGSPIALSVPAAGSTLNTLAAPQRTVPDRARADRARRADRDREPLPPRVDHRRRGSPPAATLPGRRARALRRRAVTRADAAAGLRAAGRAADVRQAGLSMTRSMSPPARESAPSSSFARSRRCSPRQRRSRQARNRSRKRRSTSRRGWRSFATCCSRSARSRCSSARS